MSSTLVIQSHKSPLPYSWLNECLASVKSWTGSKGFDYRFIDDALFEWVPQAIRQKTKSQTVIATDLGRLFALQNALDQGYESVVWCDADFLVFDSERLVLPSSENLPENYALGREVWVQPKEGCLGKLAVNIKVHNAFMLYRQGNSFLKFYTEKAERLVQKNQGTMPPQFIGPKLLTALHNVVQCPVIETAGMLSPLVIRDIIANKKDSPALKLFNKRSKVPIAGANLCSSLTENSQLSESEMQKLIRILKLKDQEIFN